MLGNVSILELVYQDLFMGLIFLRKFLIIGAILVTGGFFIFAEVKNLTSGLTFKTSESISDFPKTIEMHDGFFNP